MPTTTNVKVLKQGDTAPSVTAVLEDASGTPVDINGGFVRFLLVDAFTRLPLIEADANNDQVDGDTTGNVSYDWVEGDTDTPGSYRGEFEVSFADLTIESFPNGGVIDVEILPKAEQGGS